MRIHLILDGKEHDLDARSLGDVGELAPDNAITAAVADHLDVSVETFGGWIVDPNRDRRTQLIEQGTVVEVVVLRPQAQLG